MADRQKTFDSDKTDDAGQILAQLRRLGADAPRLAAAVVAQSSRLEVAKVRTLERDRALRAAKHGIAARAAELQTPIDTTLRTLASFASLHERFRAQKPDAQQGH